MTAGQQLRASLDAALEHASREAGKALEWSEQEQLTITRAADTADRAEVLRGRFDHLEANDGSENALVKVSAELRLLDRQVVDLVARVHPGLGNAKSERHQRAAHARWNRTG